MCFTATYNNIHTTKMEEHHYHVLESQEGTQSDNRVILPDPDAPELPPPFKPDDSPHEPPPIYQEIAELSRDSKQHKKDNTV